MNLEEFRPTPKIRTVVARMLEDGPVTHESIADKLTGRTRRSPPLDRRTREGKAHDRAWITAARLEAELWDTGEAVRVRVPGGDVLTMTVDCAEALLTEVIYGLEHAERRRAQRDESTDDQEGVP